MKDRVKEEENDSRVICLISYQIEVCPDSGGKAFESNGNNPNQQYFTFAFHDDFLQMYSNLWSCLVMLGEGNHQCKEDKIQCDL